MPLTPNDSPPKWYHPINARIAQNYLAITAICVPFDIRETDIWYQNWYAAKMQKYKY